MNNYKVASQFASRPADERFTTIPALRTRTRRSKAAAMVRGIASETLQLVPGDETISLSSPKHGDLGQLSHWSFGQLCQRVQAPAGYLRTLPPALAAIPLQWSLETSGGDNLVVMTDNDYNAATAINSPTYGRIYDDDVAAAVERYYDPAIWGVPGDRDDLTENEKKRASTLYASDRDMFLFLCAEQHKIEVNGKLLTRGVMIWNSQVGSATLGIARMLYDRCCGNRILWGVEGYQEITFRHTSGAPDRFIAQAQPQMRQIAESSTTGEVAAIKVAQNTVVGKTRKDVTEWLQRRGWTASLSRRVAERAETAIGNPDPRTLWGVVSGATEIAGDSTWTDERVALERQAGRLLDAVAS